MSLKDVIAEQDELAAQLHRQASKEVARDHQLIDEFLAIAARMGNPGMRTWHLSGEWEHDVVRNLMSPISGWILSMGEYTNIWILTDSGVLLSFWSAEGCTGDMPMREWDNQDVVARRKIYSDWGDQDLELVLATTLRRLRSEATGHGP